MESMPILGNFGRFFCQLLGKQATEANFFSGNISLISKRAIMHGVFYLFERRKKIQTSHNCL